MTNLRPRRPMPMPSISPAPLCAVVSLAPLLAAAQGAGPAQPPAQPYDVASVRQNTSASHNGNYEANPNGFKVSNLPLHFLIVIAFGTREGLVLGLPPWTGDAQFDISAKVDLPNAIPLTEKQQKAMLAAVLADRFHLKLHPETRQLPVYNLVVAAGGSKLKPHPPDQPVPKVSAIVGDSELNATGVPLTGFVEMLSDTLNREVIDQTSLTANYDIHLKWTPDRALDTDTGKSTQDPPLFTALQEQLGLKLIPAKGPVQIWVVDHIDHPTEN